MVKTLPVQETGLRRRTVLLGATLPWALSPTWAASAAPDAALFFRDEETLSAQLSPDGLRVALRTVAKHRGVMLSVLDLFNMQPTVLHSQEMADACDVSWVSPARLIFSIEERRVPEGRLDAGPGLFAINSDGTAFRQLVERQEINKTERLDSDGFSGAVPTGAAPKGVGAAAAGQAGMGFKQIADAPNVRNVREPDSDRLRAWNTYVLSPIASTTDTVLAWHPRGAVGSALDFLELNVRTGRAQALEVPGATVRAYADEAGKLRAAVVQDGGRLSTLWRDPVTNQWRSLADCAPEDTDDWAIKHIDSRGTLYVSARRGQDKLAMWTYELGSARWSTAPLVQSLEFDVDARVLVSNDKVVGFRFAIDAEVSQWLDPDLKKLQQQLDQLLPRTVNRIAVPAQGRPPVILLESFSDTQPSVYLLYHRETGKLSRLGSMRPDISSREMANVDLQRFSARDGLSIPVWVARPKSAAARPLPTVVWLQDELHAHSGQWSWDEAQQFLNARGYAVLRPELRGTRGLGMKHFRAGAGQIGLGISDDIADTVRWAVAQGISDPKRIAVAGAGFGAASGLMAMVRHPELLSCAVAWSAVTDLTPWGAANRDTVLSSTKTPAPGTPRGPSLGVAANELKSRSPLDHVASLRKPVLLAHGERDRVVPLEQADVFRKGLQAANPGSVWVVYKDEGHVWRDPANTVDFFNRVARFLDEKLTAP